MPCHYAPRADDLIGGDWTASSATVSFALLIDEPPTGADDNSYIQNATGGGAGSDHAIFDFDFPYTATYGDGTSRVLPTIGSGGVIVKARMRGQSSGSDVDMDFCVRRGASHVHGGVFTLNTGPFSTSPGPWVIASHTFTLDPITGASWDPALLAQTAFGIFKTAVGANTIQLSALGVFVDERDHAGGQRARIGPLKMEPSVNCALCSRPYHLRDLIKVEDPRHPMVGRRVCPPDYDELNREPISPELIEGDLEFDL